MLDALPPPCQPTEEALQEARRQLAALQPAASVCSPVRRPGPRLNRTAPSQSISS